MVMSNRIQNYFTLNQKKLTKKTTKYRQPTKPKISLSSKLASFDGKKAIRGGIPFVFRK